MAVHNDPALPIVVLVTGGRFYDERLHVYTVLDTLAPISLLIHGACPYGGADILAEDWAKSRQIPYIGYPAPFATMGKPAGPWRNREMIKLYGPQIIATHGCITAFPGGTGTADCVTVARAAGIKVLEPRL